jgi:hypothetical protein
MEARMIRGEQVANQLLGSRITPETLWNLTPWSWLVDWVFNIGDVLSNLSAFSNDGLVMRRGYVMRHENLTHDYTLTGIRFMNGYNPGMIYQRFSTETKIRRSASPYGFSASWPDFSPRQLAILAALGITRGNATAKYA